MKNTLNEHDKTIHKQFLKYGKNAREWKSKCIQLVPEIAKYEIWKKEGYENIYEYARILAGLSNNTVTEALRIGKKIEDKPMLRQLLAEKGLSKLRPIATIATKENQNFWAKKAREMSQHTLETYVRDIRRQESSSLQGKSHRAVTNQPEDSQKTTIEMALDKEVADQLKKLKNQENWNELMKKFIKLHEKQIEEPKPVEAKSSYIPVKVRKYVINKTNGTCAAPGCTKPADNTHHSVRKALKPVHNPRQMHLVCKAHHDIAHLGLYDDEEQNPKNWKLRTHANPNHPKFKIDQTVQKYRYK